ncbi:transposase family protein, partial [Escherichia coli]|nr:transposase family protein [Escherichia coli]
DPKERSGKTRTYRVTLVKIIDSATRMIVGRSISEHSSGVGVVLALADAFASMVDDRETVTVDGRVYPRPFVGMPRALTRWPIPPRRLITDNGKDFLSTFHVSQLARLGCEVEFARVRDPRAKALIERSFLSYKTEFE